MTKLERVIQYMDTNLSNSGLAYIMADACYEWGEVDWYWQDMESFDDVFRDEQSSQVAYLVINAGRDFDLNDEFFRTDFVEELQSCSAEEAGEDIRNNLEEPRFAWRKWRRCRRTVCLPQIVTPCQRVCYDFQARNV